MGPTCASCYGGSVKDEDPEVLERLAADVFRRMVEP